MILGYAIENDGDMEAAAMAAPYDSGDRNMVTIMKGVVDFQPQGKRLFQRWKKRYIILTPNSLFFFKKSASKVGRSEMGKFICKTSLGDITRTENLKGGVIILYMKDRTNFYLRSKEYTDWMTLINASIERLKERGSRGLQESSSRSAPFGMNMTQDAATHNGGGGASEGFYENACPPPTQSDGHDVIKQQQQQQSSRTTNDIGSSNHKPEVPNSNGGIRGADPNIETTTTTTMNDWQEIGRGRTKTTIASSAAEEINSSSIEQQKEQNDNQRERGDNVSSDNADATAAHLSENGKRPQSMINNDVAPASDGPLKATTHADEHFGSGDPLSEATRDSGVRARKAHASKHSPNQSTQNSTASSSVSTGTKRTTGQHLDQDGTISRETLKSGASCGSNSTTDKLVSGGSSSGRSAHTRTTEQTSTESKRQGSGDDEHRASLVRDHRGSDNCELASANEQSNGQVAGQQRVVGRRDSKQQERPNIINTNLIRRDDSWQSLVSLTQAGRQVQKPSAAMDRNGGQTRRPPSIDSTATPMRNKPLRQQSLQAYPPPRRLPFLGETPQHQPQWQASSFDAPPPQIPSSPSLQYNHQRPTQQPQQIPTTSYHQKLLQLQLLHQQQQQQHHNNGNNIDYIRQSATPQANLASGGGNNDYQIYGPESIATTNHYGYYSMRSNLKSAASEFSFIRPSSSNIHKPTPPGSHLPPFGPAPLNQQHASYAHDQPSRQMTASPSVNGQYLLQGPTVSSWQPPPEQRPPPVPIEGPLAMQMATAGPNQAGLIHPALVTDLAAPNRDLPLKPNKRRQPANLAEPNRRQKNPGSGIVRFLKRAFSTKRSRRQAKLAESCSSSMMGANFESIQVAPQSAYSTGSKEYQAERGAYLAQQHQSAQLQPPQQQRMIDLIEAFANKTALDDETYQRRSKHLASVEASRMAHQQQQMSTLQRREIFGATRLRASGMGRHPQMASSGSTLQKSNSISTSSGFGMIATQQQRLQQGGNLDREDTRAGGYMPLVTRSTKVMSANLTPVFNRKDGNNDFVGPSVSHFASPRHSANFSTDHHAPLPRPSSIYGQPSMISSPVISNGRSSDFGAHRNSSHGYPGGARAQNQNIVDFRRHHHQQASKAPILDTTREVAEEMISSPTGEAKPLVVEYGQQRSGRDPRDQSMASYQIDANGNLISGADEQASPRMPPMLSGGNYSQHHGQRRAIVNPILQSPTMSLIYDNHPSVRQPADHSHYDNTGYPVPPMNQQQQHQYPSSISSMELASRDPAASSAYYLGDVSDHQRLTSSPFAAGKLPSRSRQSYNLGDPSGADFSPLRQIRLSQQHPGCFMGDFHGGAATPTRAMALGKPAAIVTPSTPRSSGQRGTAAESNSDLVPQPSPVIGGPRSGGAIAAVSPIASRRFINHAQQQPLQYQQSPLVNRQTRVLKRGDGVQATVMSATDAETSQRQIATEVSVDDRFHAMDLETPASRRFDSETVALVQSDELRSGKTDNGRNRLQGNGFSVDKVVVNGHSAGLSKDEEAASSRSTGSSSSNSTGTKSIGRSVHRNNKSSASERGSGGNLTSSRQLLNDKQRRRGSSSEHSDELSSQTGSIDEPDEKNWVNSKLMQ